jgi:hypothetical protein
MLAISSSVEAYGRRSSSCVEFPRANDGKHGSPGYVEDGEDGENEKKAKMGKVVIMEKMEEMPINI